MAVSEKDRQELEYQRGLAAHRAFLKREAVKLELARKDEDREAYLQEENRREARLAAVMAESENAAQKIQATMPHAATDSIVYVAPVAFVASTPHELLQDALNKPLDDYMRSHPEWSKTPFAEPGTVMAKTRRAGQQPGDLTQAALMEQIPLVPSGEKQSSPELQQRRLAVVDVLDDASAAAGVPRALMSGMWAMESSCGKNLVSQTFCMGDWQFSKKTFASMIEQHGAEIAAQLGAHGQTDMAQKVEDFSAALKSGDMKRYDEDLQALRMDPRVSTYAAAFLAKSIAGNLKVDAMNQDSWGKIYAAYNVGEGNVRKLAGALADQEFAGAHIDGAGVNSAFYGDRTGREVLAKYGEKILGKAAQGEAVVNQTLASAGPQPSAPLVS